MTGCGADGWAVKLVAPRLALSGDQPRSRRAADTAPEAFWRHDWPAAFEGGDRLASAQMWAAQVELALDVWSP